MNPFLEHAANMADYQTQLAQPIDNDTEEFVQFLGGGKVVAVVSHFEVRQVLLSSGGMSPRLTAQAIIQKSALPKSFIPKSGNKLMVKQVGSAVRSCQIEFVDDEFTEWRLELWDVAEKA